jgi:hypothetical protein
MKNRLVIILPALVLLSVVIYSIYFMLPYYAYALWPITSHFLKLTPITQGINQQLGPYIPQTTPQALSDKINQYRQSHNLSKLSQVDGVCGAPAEATISASLPMAVCPNCTHSALISISKFATTNQLMTRLIQEPSAKETLENPELTHLCVAEQPNMLTLLFTHFETPKLSHLASTNIITPQTINPKTNPATPQSFTETELWLALVNYRHAHERSDLALEESICAYARKRVQDQITLRQNTSAENYPNPDKYPLDAHQGFSADAQSGYAFEVTGMTHLAENLAYYPSATNPTQIIEWGWDTSTEGHREAQLSNDWTKACISGKDGFYVAIFGN